MKERIVFLDYLRIMACFMVMLVHSNEPFYLGGEGTLILNHTDALTVTLINSALRACVPLFVMVSSYLLFPVRGDASAFYRKRAKRVLIPFVFWLLLYALLPLFSQPFQWYSWTDIQHNLGQLCFNFVGAAGHLWFVYMLIGLYIVMPIFSPWIEKVSKRGELWFLGLWAFTMLAPLWRYAALQFSGLDEVMGEANWNRFGTIYYVSGFVGYVVLGHYIRTYVKEWSWRRTLAVVTPLLAAGYATSVWGFWSAMPQALPYEGPIDTAVRMELFSWGFCTPSTMLMTLGYFLLARKFTWKGWLYEHLAVPISNASYSMYLMHIFWLTFFVVTLRQVMDCTAIIIFLTAVLTFISSFITTKIISHLPVVGKWLTGCIR